ESIESNTTEYDWPKAYENKFDDYFRIDLRIGFKINGKKLNQEWALDLQNITNYKNIYRQSYNPRTHDISFDYQTGFFPMFLYRITKQVFFRCFCIGYSFREFVVRCLVFVVRCLVLGVG
ncbi:MAG: hypothetical protein B6D64_15155, partial [Bacteroidetes bacterium 4484_276]